MAKQLDSIVSPCKITEITIVTFLRTHNDLSSVKDIYQAMDQTLKGDNFPSFHCLRIDKEAFDYFPSLNSRGMLEAWRGDWWPQLDADQYAGLCPEHQKGQFFPSLLSTEDPSHGSFRSLTFAAKK